MRLRSLQGGNGRFPLGSLPKEGALAAGSRVPGHRVTVERAVASGDQVTIEQTGRGTHTGTLQSPGGDIPATGRSVTLQLCDVFTIEGGKITSMRSYFDSALIWLEGG